jgi:hypothetical protein
MTRRDGGSSLGHDEYLVRRPSTQGSMRSARSLESAIGGAADRDVASVHGGTPPPPSARAATGGGGGGSGEVVRVADAAATATGDASGPPAPAHSYAYGATAVASDASHGRVAVRPSTAAPGVGGGVTPRGRDGVVSYEAISRLAVAREMRRVQDRAATRIQVRRAGGIRAFARVRARAVALIVSCRDFAGRRARAPLAVAPRMRAERRDAAARVPRALGSGARGADGACVKHVSRATPRVTRSVPARSAPRGGTQPLKRSRRGRAGCRAGGASRRRAQSASQQRVPPPRASSVPPPPRRYRPRRGGGRCAGTCDARGSWSARLQRRRRRRDCRR